MLTVVTGLVDAVSFIALGHVFVANMTGNVVFVGFALAGTPGLSLSASLRRSARSWSVRWRAGGSASASTPTAGAIWPAPGASAWC